MSSPSIVRRALRTHVHAGTDAGRSARYDSVIEQIKIYFNEVDKGGHFAAWEQPELFAAELRAAFKSLR